MAGHAPFTGVGMGTTSLENWQCLSTGDQASRLKQPALIVHDHDDIMVPWPQGKAFAASWPGAHFFSTRGLGHWRILRDPAVVQEVVRFVVGKPDPARPGELG